MLEYRKKSLMLQGALSGRLRYLLRFYETPNLKEFVQQRQYCLLTEALLEEGL